MDYAKSTVVHWHRAKSSKHFSGISKESLDSPGIHLVEIPVNYSEDEKMLIDELSAIACIV